MEEAARSCLLSYTTSATLCIQLAKGIGMNRMVGAWQVWLEKSLAPNTCKLYERTVLMLERDKAREGALETLETKHLLSWLHEKKGSTGTYANRVAALRSFYGYLFDQEQIPEDPSRRLEIPKQVRSAREPVRDLQAKLRELDDLDERVGRRVGESADMAVFLAQTGMRISDACALSLNPPVPHEISIPRGRRPDKVFELSPLARGALDRLGGRFGIGARALQRRFEKVGFHPDQLRHWHRVNLGDRELRDHQVESVLRMADPSSDEGVPPVRPVMTHPVAEDPLNVFGRFLKLAEEVTVVLVREARRQGKGWEEIAHALWIPEATAKERFSPS